MIKLIIYGLSGSGKSTIAKLVRSYFEERERIVQVVKIAQPLYEIQHYFYEKLQVPHVEGTQDQILLENVASNIRRIAPTYLVDTFMNRVRESEASVIINDDLRDYQTDYPRLLEAGFIFVKVTCEEEIRQKRLLSRNDLSIVENSETTKHIQDFNYHFHIDNSKLSMDKLRNCIHEMLEAFK